jgi:hypothetical protein
MTILIILFALTAFVLFWVVVGRAWLKSMPGTARFFAVIEPVEIALWSKSETILWARFLPFMMALSGFLTWLGALDVTPLYLLLPEKYHPWLAAVPFVTVALLGAVNEILRRFTTRPLEIVAVPDNAPPAVAAAIEAAQVAKVEAVAEIKKDAGKIKAMSSAPSEQEDDS